MSNDKINNTEEIIQDLEHKKVLIDDFYLWHNNPRIIDDSETERSIEFIDVDGEQDKLFNKLKKDHHVLDLVRSILTHGWKPITSSIVVAEYNSPNNGKKYIALEGNRRITALKIIVEAARNGYKNVPGIGQYMMDDITDFEKNQLEAGVSCKTMGDIEKFSDNDWELVDSILNITHLEIGTRTWPLHQKSRKVFKDYMKLLSDNDDNVDAHEPFDFYLDTKMIKQLSGYMGEKTGPIKEYLWLYTLRNQLKNKLYDLNTEFPKEKSSYVVEFLKKPDLRRRYHFDEITGRIESESMLDTFVSLCFEYGDNKPVINQASKGGNSIREYASVVKNDRTDDQKYIRMVEEDRESPRVVMGELTTANRQYAIEDGIEKVLSILGKFNIDKLVVADFGNDRLRDMVLELEEKISVISQKMTDWYEKNKK